MPNDKNGTPIIIGSKIRRIKDTMFSISHGIKKDGIYVVSNINSDGNLIIKGGAYDPSLFVVVSKYTGL